MNVTSMLATSIFIRFNPHSLYKGDSDYIRVLDLLHCRNGVPPSCSLLSWSGQRGMTSCGHFKPRLWLLFLLFPLPVQELLCNTLQSVLILYAVRSTRRESVTAVFPFPGIWGATCTGPMPARKGLVADPALPISLLRRTCT